MKGLTVIHSTALENPNSPSDLSKGRIFETCVLRFRKILQKRKSGNFWRREMRGKRLNPRAEIELFVLL